MIIEFYLADGKSFMREMPIPLPPTYRIAIRPKVGAFFTNNNPLLIDENYIEFKLGIIKYKYHPLSNVVGLPRKAYREIKK